MATNEAVPAVTNESTLIGNWTLKDIVIYLGIPLSVLVAVYGVNRLLSSSSEGEQTEDSQPERDTDSSNDSGIENSLPEDTPEQAPLEQAKRTKERGNKYFKAQNFEKAIQCYREAISICPTTEPHDMAIFYQNLAACYEQMGNWSAVIEESSNAIQLNPRYTKALVKRSKAYDATGQRELALEDVTASVLLKDYSQPTMILADRILKSLAEEKAKAYYKEREKLLPSKIYIRSYLDSYSRDVFSIPDLEEGQGGYQEALSDMDNDSFEDIIDLCSQEIEYDGKFKELATLLRGTMYCLKGQIDLSIADLDAVVALPDSDANNKLKVNALIKRGSLRMQQADDTSCYADFTLALSLDDTDASIYHHRGQLYFLTEQMDKAEEDFQKAISLDSNFLAPRCHLGLCLSKIGMQTMSSVKMKEANDILEEATRKFPTKPEAWSLYGQLLQDQQEFSKAMEMLNKSLEIDPNNPTTYVYKALLIMQTNQTKEGIEEAIASIRKAIEVDDKCDFAYETLATLEMQRGNSEEALRLLTRILDLVRTEAELVQVFSMMVANKAQMKIIKQYGITPPNLMG